MGGRRRRQRLVRRQRRERRTTFAPHARARPQPRERRLRARGQPGAGGDRGPARADHEPRLPAAAGRVRRARRRTATRSERCAIVGPRILNPDGSVQGSARGDPDMFTGLFGRTTLLRRMLPALAVSKRNVVGDAASSGAERRRSTGCRARACSRAATRSSRSTASTSATSCTGRTPICAGGCAARGYHVRYVPAATAIHRVGHSSRTARVVRDPRVSRERVPVLRDARRARRASPKRLAGARAAGGARCWLEASQQSTPYGSPRH